MNLILLALRRPITVIVAIVAIVVGCFGLCGGWMSTFFRAELAGHLRRTALRRNGPGQMEGLLTNYYEYHFLYISGIHHVESKNIQGLALMKLIFHPGTNMPQAMAETISYVNRSQAFMPPGTVSPFVMRFDTGSVPVGYLVLSSDTRTLAEIQDLALFRVRPMFATLPGVSAPPPFGGNQRTIVINVDPDRLRAYHISLEEVISRWSHRQHDQPVGQRAHRRQISDCAAQLAGRKIDELGDIPMRKGLAPVVYLRNLATVQDSSDLADRLCPGQRPPGHLPAGHEAGRRVDAERRQRSEAKLDQDAGRASRRYSSPLRVRPVSLRHARIRGLAIEGLLGSAC